VLISGSSQERINLDDLKSNTKYAGGYSPLDVNVFRFWNIVKNMAVKDQHALLRFVTSCERPPPLGFASLNPCFCLQRIQIFSDSDKLPAASTCFNVLKLPTYSSEKVMRQKILESINSGSGFDLS